MSIETTDNDSTQIDDNEELSKAYMEVLKKSSSILYSVDQHGITEDLKYKVCLDEKGKERLSYMVDDGLQGIQDAGFRISHVDFEGEYILVEPENVILEEVTEENVRRVFDDPMTVTELDYIEGAYDVQVDGRKPIDSEMIDELRDIGYEIADISATYRCTGLPYKYVAIKPIE